MHNTYTCVTQALNSEHQNKVRSFQLDLSSSRRGPTEAAGRPLGAVIVLQQVLQHGRDVLAERQVGMTTVKASRGHLRRRVSLVQMRRQKPVPGRRHVKSLIQPLLAQLVATECNCAAVKDHWNEICGNGYLVESFTEQQAI